MSWPPTLLMHPPRPWAIDATAMAITPDALDALPWSAAFGAMQDLESGAIANPDEGRQVGHYWLRAPELAPTLGQAKAIGEVVEAARAFAHAIRAGSEPTDDGRPFTDVLHVGIGGSALGPQLLVAALGGGGLRMHFLDNTDPDGIAAVLTGLGDRLETTLVVVVSKSGGTAETRNGMLLAIEALAARKLDAPSRLVAITGEGSKLHQQATREGWRRIFPMWDWVGGRTSVTSAVGLLPAELAGIDGAALLAGARDMDEWTRHDTWRDNPAALLAGCWHVTGDGRGDRAMVVLPYSDRLLLFSRYLQQLVMESIGKRLDLAGHDVQQGLTVYGNKGSTDQHAYVQQLRDGRPDIFVTFVQVLGDGAGSPREVEPGVTSGDYLQGFLLGTRRALRESGRPSLTITVPHLDAYVLGGLIALYERAVGLYAALIGINAYHQPGVEAGKKAAGEILALSAKLRDEARRAPGTAIELAERVGGDPIEALHVLERLVATQRLGRDGDPPGATYRARKASDA